MDNQISNVTKKAKSFWDSTEGTTGMVVGMAALGLLGWGAYKIMPFVVNLLQNTVYAIVLGLVALGLVWGFVIDGTLRSRLWIGYKLLMRAITFSMIRPDPIGALRVVQANAKKRIGTVQEQTDKVGGQLQIINSTLESYQSDVKQFYKKYDYYKSKGQESTPEALSITSKLGRLGDSIKRLSVSQERTTTFNEQLKRALRALEIIHENIDFEITVVEREYKATNAAHSAWQSVRAAFKGGDMIDEFGQDAFAFLKEDYNNKLGEIDSFMNDSSKFLNDVDISQAMLSQDGLKMLDEMNNRDILGLVQPLNIIEHEPIVQSTTGSSAYKKIINK